MPPAPPAQRAVPVVTGRTDAGIRAGRGAAGDPVPFAPRQPGASGRLLADRRRAPLAAGPPARSDRRRRGGRDPASAPAAEPTGRARAAGRRPDVPDVTADE